MKNKGKQSKAKAPVKPKHTVVHLYFENKEDLELLESIKKMTGYTVATKAVYEALLGYPKFVNKSDNLNKELMKVNREYEILSTRVDSLKRAFSFISESGDKKEEMDEDFIGMNLGPEDIECTVCGFSTFDADGDCDECGHNRWEEMP